MKEIIIEELMLINFKGIRQLTINFEAGKTVISGRNGIGKTTIADAITWLLFGKDSKDREKFEIKTLDSDGRIIQKLPHEVSGRLRVNGEEIRLTRRLIEKWVKTSGKTETVFKGNEVERLYNDVPYSDAEFKIKIAEICTEQDFKFITNPYHFCSQKSEVQKSRLLKMAGEITDEDIAKNNEGFKILLQKISGKSMDEFKREISAKKNRIKAELSGIPDRIDEKKRSLPEKKDWSILEKELKDKQSALDGIESQIMDIAKRNEAQDNSIREIYTEISELRNQISKREEALTNKVNQDFFKQQEVWMNLHQEAMGIKTDLPVFDKKIQEIESEISAMSSRREGLIKEWNSLKAREKEIKERLLVFDDNQFICPACHRPLEMDDIEKRQAEIRANFEIQKQNDLNSVAELKSANMKAGSTCSLALIEERRKSISELVANKQNCEARYKTIVNSPGYINEPKKIDASPVIMEDPQILELNSRIEGLQNKVSLSAKKIDMEELNLKRSSIMSGINVVNHALSEKVIYERDTNRIKELESQYSKLSAELAEQEKLEFLLDEFSKAKNREVARRIDSLFSIVKFRWIAPQINGGEKETCEATVNGIPYASLNRAGKINAGLDIINAICRDKGIAAPILIDNAESCTDYIATLGQVILFRVSTDKELIITNN